MLKWSRGWERFQTGHLENTIISSATVPNDPRVLRGGLGPETLQSWTHLYGGGLLHQEAREGDEDVQERCRGLADAPHWAGNGSFPEVLCILIQEGSPGATDQLCCRDEGHGPSSLMVPQSSSRGSGSSISRQQRRRPEGPSGELATFKVESKEL